MHVNVNEYKDGTGQECNGQAPLSPWQLPQSQLLLSVLSNINILDLSLLLFVEEFSFLLRGCSLALLGLAFLVLEAGYYSAYPKH